MESNKFETTLDSAYHGTTIQNLNFFLVTKTPFVSKNHRYSFSINFSIRAFGQSISCDPKPEIIINGVWALDPRSYTSKLILPDKILISRIKRHFYLYLPSMVLVTLFLKSFPQGFLVILL